MGNKAGIHVQSWRKTIVMICFSLVLAMSVGWPYALAESALPDEAEISEDALIHKAEVQLTPESAEAFLDSFFLEPMMESQYVGAVVGIVRDGETIALKGYGYADKENGIEIDPARTVFRIASVSKTFVAVAIMQLAEQGIIDLQADIREYIPDLQFENPFDTPVTVEHLLLHKSGFEVRDPHMDDYYFDPSLFFDMEEYVHSRMPNVVREPGSAYMYENFGYLLLGLIVQNASGMPFAEYMENEIFAPLGMSNSGFIPEGHLREQMATGYGADQQPVDFYLLKPTVMPHGGMLSTAEDMTRFMIAMLNGGTAENGETLLSESSVAEMFTYRSYVHPLLPDTTYGFESAVQIPQAGASDKIVTKAGDLPGFSTYLFFIPEQNTGVFLSVNQVGTLRESFYRQFISTFFPEYAAPVEFDNPDASSVEQLSAYSGLYADLRLGSIVTKVEAEKDGVLFVSDAYVGPRYLYQVDENLFVDEITMQLTGFKKDERAGTVYMKEPYLNPLGYAKQGVKPQGFMDIGEDHPYAEYIYGLQSLGFYPNDASISFDPQRPLTRAEFVRLLLEVSKVEPTQSDDYAFVDIADHPDAPYIHTAYLLGAVQGDGEGRFDPDRHITRQEAAVIIWTLSREAYPDEWFEDVKIAGDTAEWAVPAVKMMVGFQLFGPEVVITQDGAIDYLPREVLTHEQAAALMYLSLVQPINAIAAELAANAAAEEEVEPVPQP